jgi:hypothetical protein
MKETDVECVVLLGKRGPLEAQLEKMGIRYAYIPYSTDIKEKNALKNLAKKCKNQIAIRKIQSFLKQEKVDLVHSNSMLVSVGNQTARRMKIPYVMHARDMVKEDHHITLLHEAQLQDFLSHAALAIYISAFVKQKFQKIAPKAKYTVLSDGINTEKYQLPPRAYFQAAEISLLMAGRISPGKGQMEALQALRILNEKSSRKFRMQIVGSPGNNAIDLEYDAQLKQYAQAHALKNVEFIRFTDLTELRRHTDIGLICSTNEAMGRVTLESMLSRCITVGANAGATPELIQDGETGWLYTSGNPESLADTILKASQMTNEAAGQMAEKASAFVCDHFSVAEYTKKLVQIYRLIGKENAK